MTTRLDRTFPDLSDGQMKTLKVLAEFTKPPGASLYVNAIRLFARNTDSLDFLRRANLAQEVYVDRWRITEQGLELLRAIEAHEEKEAAR